MPGVRTVLARVSALSTLVVTLAVACLMAGYAEEALGALFRLRPNSWFIGGFALVAGTYASLNVIVGRGLELSSLVERRLSLRESDVFGVVFRIWTCFEFSDAFVCRERLEG